MKLTSARESLAEEDHVGLDVVPLAAEHLSRSSETLGNPSQRKKERRRLPGQLNYKMESSWRRDEEGETHSLDLVADEQNVVLLAELLDLLQVPIVRNEDPGLTLNGLDEERSCLSPHLVEHGGEGGNVVVRDFELAKSGEERAKVLARFGVGRHGNDRDGASVEIAVNQKETRVSLWGEGGGEEAQRRRTQRQRG